MHFVMRIREVMRMNKKLINYLGLLGILSFISYFLAVVISPTAYPDYNWLERAVSDLSADDAPSLKLWNQIAAPYALCGVTSLTVLCIYIKDKFNKPLRVGIYLFCIMNWISAIGYGLFPLTQSDGGGGFQDVMHIVVTVVVVLLSIVSLIFIIVGSFRKKTKRSLGIVSIVILVLMSTSSISTVVPHEIFGLVERFSTLSVTGYTAILGLYLFMDFFPNEKECLDFNLSNK